MELPSMWRCLAAVGIITCCCVHLVAASPMPQETGSTPRATATRAPRPKEPSVSEDAPAVTTYSDANVPLSVIQSCGDRYAKVSAPHTCEPLTDVWCQHDASWPPKLYPDQPDCVAAPASLLSPPFTGVLWDCEHTVYTGQACIDACSSKLYCTRDPDAAPAVLPTTAATRTGAEGDDDVPASSITAAPGASVDDRDRKCRYGLVTKLTGRTCNSGIRCNMNPSPGSMLPRCRDDFTRPIDWTPQVRTDWDRCAVTIATGAPCEGCPNFCTIPGNLPGGVMSRFQLDGGYGEAWRACEGGDDEDARLVTKTVASACPTLLCDVRSRPVPCGVKLSEPPLPVTGESPWTKTIGCDVYVQTEWDGCKDHTCQQWCTSTEAPELSLIMPTFGTVA